MKIRFYLKKAWKNLHLRKHTNHSEIDWISIPGGVYLMGSPENELNRKDDETQHLVTVLPFRISKYAITVHQFKEFVETTGYVTDAEKGKDEEKGSIIWKGYTGKFKTGINWRWDELGRKLSNDYFDHPVVHISWNDAKSFAEWKECRLPTEAEWEYACRAGTTTPFNTGNELNPKLANYKPNSFNGKKNDNKFNNGILPVGSFKPNAWGLCEMHGNVGEWCSDHYGHYPSAPLVKPVEPESGDYRIVRGGSWLSYMRSCRSARRISCKPDDSMYDIGFRVAL